MKTLHFLTYLFFSTICSGQVISTIAGTGVHGFSGEEGPAINAEFSFLCGVTADKYGNIYIADRFNAVIQKIDAHGILHRFAGNGYVGDRGDGGPATAASIELGLSVGLAIDEDSSLYIAAGRRVRKVNTAGIITTIAGTGTYGSSGDGGPATAAELRSATGLCFDKEGNLYIADEQSSNIRKINAAGIITTVAGTTFGFSGDGGPATLAQLKSPMGIAIDNVGNLYIADLGNNMIRKINTANKISTIAGGGGSWGLIFCTGCIATVLQLNGPMGICTDRNNNVYIAVISNEVVHKILPDGRAYILAGSGEIGDSGDGGPATTAKLNSPTMICLDRDGNLLIADKANARIRKVWIGTAYTPSVSRGSSLLYAYPNPAVNKSFTCNAITADTSESADLVITDVLGRLVSTALITTNTATDIPLPVPAGMYFLSATTRSGYKMSAKIIVQ